MEREVHEVALAKVNLFLHITGRRTDGYHELQSLVSFANIGDILEVQSLESGEETRLEVHGPFAKALEKSLDRPESNLVLKAINLFREYMRLKTPILVRLNKQLPVAAGIGGGSANAAAALRAINRAFGRPCSQSTLEEISLELGSDVPMCVAQRAAWVEGVGEKITVISRLKPWPVVFINPLFPLQTELVYKLWQKQGLPFKNAIQMPQDNAWERLCLQSENVLLPAAERMCPLIPQILKSLSKLPGCWLSRLSGGGATCFGLFDKIEEAVAGAQLLEQRFPLFWIKATYLTGC